MTRDEAIAALIAQSESEPLRIRDVRKIAAALGDDGAELAESIEEYADIRRAHREGDAERTEVEFEEEATYRVIDRLVERIAPKCEEHGVADTPQHRMIQRHEVRAR